MKEIVTTLYQAARPLIIYSAFTLVSAYFLNMSKEIVFLGEDSFFWLVFLLYFYGGLSWHTLNTTMETQEEIRKNNEKKSKQT